MSFFLPGSDVDRNALDQLFRTVLGFEVVPFLDLNKESFQERLSYMANYIAMSPFQYDRLFVAILSHGDKVRPFKDSSHDATAIYLIQLIGLSVIVTIALGGNAH